MSQVHSSANSSFPNLSIHKQRPFLGITIFVITLLGIGVTALMVHKAYGRDLPKKLDWKWIKQSADFLKKDGSIVMLTTISTVGTSTTLYFLWPSHFKKTKKIPLPDEATDWRIESYCLNYISQEQLDTLYVPLKEGEVIFLLGKHPRNEGTSLIALIGGAGTRYCNYSSEEEKQNAPSTMLERFGHAEANFGIRLTTIITPANK